MKNDSQKVEDENCTIMNPTCAADFETAVSATGYGKFNILLLVLTIPSAFLVQFESTLPSYILPAAECDLDITLQEKGLINSAVFLGMILGGPLWGFLLDTVGRRKMIFIGCLLSFLVSIANSFTQTITYMAICKLLGGSLSGGIYIASIAYLQEFHALKYRGRIQMVFGVIYGLANLTMPLLASFFLPLKFHVTIFNLIEFRSWNLFLMASSSASLITAISFKFLPETPKYLMSTGKTEEALLVFRNAYRINSGKSPNCYPVSKLVEEKLDVNKGSQSNRSFTEYMKNGWKQISPLFHRKHLPKLMLVCTMQPLIQMSLNTFRLWLPQIFQTIHEYQVKNNGTTPSMCTIIEIYRPNDVLVESECSVNLENNFAVYFNSVVVGVVTVAGYIMGGMLINLFGRKKLLLILGFCSGVMAASLYFSQNVESLIGISAIHIALSSVCFDIGVTIIVALFPTTLRGTALSVAMLAGRSLTVAGQIVFPVLLETNCEAPFSALSASMLVATGLACFLPNVDNKLLE